MNTNLKYTRFAELYCANNLDLQLEHANTDPADQSDNCVNPAQELLLSFVPKQVAAEDEAEHEDEEANAQDDDIDVERQVEELFGCHLAVGVDVLQSKVTQTPWEETHKERWHGMETGAKENAKTTWLSYLGRINHMGVSAHQYQHSVVAITIFFHSYKMQYFLRCMVFFF